MRPPEFLDVGVAHIDSGTYKTFGLAAIRNPAFTRTDGTITIRSSMMNTARPDYPIGVLCLQLSTKPPGQDGRQWKWAIHHWLGSLAKPFAFLFEVWEMKDPYGDREALEWFDRWERSWRKHGRLFPGVQVGTNVGRNNQNAQDVLTGRVHTARLKVLKSQWPVTVSAIMRGKGAAKAFDYERETVRPDVDPINYELALNGLEYMNCTAEELADKIVHRCQKEIKSEAAKKRRDALGLFSERPPGPRATPAARFCQ